MYRSQESTAYHSYSGQADAPLAKQQRTEGVMAAASRIPGFGAGASSSLDEGGDTQPQAPSPQQASQRIEPTQETEQQQVKTKQVPICAACLLINGVCTLKREHPVKKGKEGGCPVSKEECDGLDRLKTAALKLMGVPQSQCRATNFNAWAYLKFLQKSSSE